MSTNSSKTLVRYAEKNVLGSNQARVFKPSVASSNEVSTTSTNYNTNRKLPPLTKYSDPELLTSNNFVKQMKAVEDMPTKKYEHNDIEREDRISAHSEKVKRLNFHYSEKVYKDLVVLNISEKDKTHCMKTRPSSVKFIPASRRDIEPKLQDFYSQEEQVDVPIAVSSLKVQCFPSVKFNGLDFYHKFNSWDR